MSTKYVLFYQPADNVDERAPLHFPAHKERLDAFQARGDLLMVGVFAERQEHGSMSIFRSREAAEEFVEDDPFILNGVIRSWELREWHEALTD
jgi:hypothetical protein